jgi:DNA-directed RNA polymerase specialized sigma24 family protein
VKRWLLRAAIEGTRRTEEPRNRFARWTARWKARTPTVPASRFQGIGEPFPDHWRSELRQLPAGGPTDAELAAAVAGLPATWREVVIARDVLGRQPDDVAVWLGLTKRQQRAILNRARAALRERLVDGGFE